MLVEDKDDLERKGDLSREILMQAVVATRLIAQKQRRWSRLTMLMTTLEKAGQVLWISNSSVTLRRG